MCELSHPKPLISGITTRGVFGDVRTRVFSRDVFGDVRTLVFSRDVFGDVRTRVFSRDVFGDVRTRVFSRDVFGMYVRVCFAQMCVCVWCGSYKREVHHRYKRNESALLWHTHSHTRT